MYLFDPRSGRRRRARARDQGAAACRKAARYATGKSRRLADHAKGSLARIRARATIGPVDDETLVQRVRAGLGHVAAHPGAIAVEAREGRVVLKGDVGADELRDIVGRVAAIAGVVEVDDRLLPQEAGPGGAQASH
ncbi:transporter [Pseudoxanthomonas broegbernensis]|uniref:Transporter n=2 Tax=Pseudoxanthomonas broegbernensis TaxID=83619 RepID=A0A7V8GM90_9GAMM|nr:transporter [Pseudoxanthomonas broegbernensis]